MSRWMASMYSCSSLVGLVSSKRRWQRPPIFLRDAEIQADRLGVADVQVAVRLRRKPRDHVRHPLRRQVRIDDFANEVAGRFGCRGNFSCCHNLCPEPAARELDFTDGFSKVACTGSIPARVLDTGAGKPETLLMDRSKCHRRSLDKLGQLADELEAAAFAEKHEISPGAGGFEPPHDGVKVRCLTAWRRPTGTGRIA